MKIRPIEIAFLLSFCLTGISADRVGDIAKIEKFLKNDQISQQMVKKGVKTDDLLKEINKLDDEQVAILASETPDLLKVGSGTEYYESSTAERVSDKWLSFANKWLMIGLGVTLLMFLLVI
jgi:hypothetical protein